TVEADVTDDRLAHQPGVDQLADAAARRGRVVGDHGEIAFALADDLVNQAFGRADRHEPTDHQAGAVGDHGNRFVESHRLHIDSSPSLLARYCAVQPPSTGKAAPRISAAASEHRNTVNAPICSGVAKASDGCFSTSGVSTKPGQIALQVIPVVAVSSATTLVNPITPCLAAT